MAHPSRYLARRYMEPNHSQLLNWERQAEQLLFANYGTCRYHHVYRHVIRNPRMRPLLNNGRKHHGR